MASDNFHEYGCDSTVHVHTDERGFPVKCYHFCRNLLTDYKFWIGMTMSYPLEHALWTKVWPFATIAHYFGLMH